MMCQVLGMGDYHVMCQELGMGDHHVMWLLRGCVERSRQVCARGRDWLEHNRVDVMTLGGAKISMM